MRTNLRALLVLTFLSATSASTAIAQTFPYDHVHLAAPDPAKAVSWYVEYLNAKRGDGPDRVVIGRTIFAFAKADAAQPSAGGSIDHIGFSVTDVDATMKAMVAGGATVLTPARDVPGLFKLGFVQDPFGVKLEIVGDSETPGFHHIHLLVPDPEASLKWTLDHFGGTRAKLKGRIDAIKYSNPDVWVLAQKGDSPAPSLGRAIDHLGWAVPNVGQKVAALSAAGMKPTEPRPVRHLNVAFVDGPGAVRIEMVQGRKEEELQGH